MHDTLAIIQARLGSTRLRGKLARRLGGKSLLEWVVRRVTDCQHVDQVIVAAGDSPENDAICELVPSDVPIFRGSELDVLARFAGAIKAHPTRGVVRVCADNPFIDPELIERLVLTAEEHSSCDYISYCTSNGRPVVLSSLGLFAEWCRADALLQADRIATHALDREHVTRFLYSHPEVFRTRLVALPSRLDRDDMRLTVDYEEDWEHAEAIFELLGPEELDWQRIAGLLDQQPALRKRMADMNRQYIKA